MTARTIAMLVIGGVNAFFVGLGIICISDGYGGSCVDVFLWGTIALTTAIVLWRRPTWLS